MNRQILVGMVGLAFAGCASTGPAKLPSGTGSSPPPVATTPAPDISAAVNGDNARLDPASVPPERGPVVANLGAPLVSPNAVPDQAPTMSKAPETAATQTSGAPGVADPASGGVRAVASDPLLGAEPDVVPLPAPSAPPDTASEVPPPVALPPAAGVQPEPSS